MVSLTNRVKQKKHISKYDNLIDRVSYIFVIWAACKYLEGFDCKRSYIEAIKGHIIWYKRTQSHKSAYLTEIV